MNKPIIILGIESSCDDTAAAVIKDGILLSNCIANQDIHKLYGGVVPELASRAHQQNILPVVETAIQKAGITKEQISAIAFTRGPGLMGSLLVGTSFAKAFALGLNIPLIEVNHMQGHILSHFIKTNETLTFGDTKLFPEFPFLCLTVSGGHTQIVVASDFFDLAVIGETLDDAAGEAFDKAAKILGLPYPGGPLIDKYAQEGNPLKYKFTKPIISDLDFSFSGLKTNFINFMTNEIAKNANFIEQNRNDLCASIQYTIIHVLVDKLKKAALQTGIRNIAIAGGVSANSGLRELLSKVGNQLGWQLFIPKFEYCTDNAAMIAITGYLKYLKTDFADQLVTPLPRYAF